MATKAKAKQRKRGAGKPWLGKRGRQHPRSTAIITPFGRFASQALAAAALGVSPGLIWQRLSRGRPGVSVCEAEEVALARYIATVEYDAGTYWTRFPGIEKAGSHAERPEDIVSHACGFLDYWVQHGGAPPASLDDAITEPSAPFEGVRLVIFEWDPPVPGQCRE